MIVAALFKRQAFFDSLAWRLESTSAITKKGDLAAALLGIYGSKAYLPPVSAMVSGR